jgi:uncharacterized protein YqjF (DUF2071 family)
MYHFIYPYLYEAQQVSGDTSPIIRSLKLHWQTLVFHTWKVVGRVVGGPCQAHYCAYLYEAQHVSGDTLPIIRSLKLKWQSLVFYTWTVGGRVVAGRCQAQYVPDNVQQLHVQQPSTYEKPETISAVLGS